MRLLSLTTNLNAVGRNAFEKGKNKHSFLQRWYYFGPKSTPNKFAATNF
jgi:hypothetical protein